MSLHEPTDPAFADLHDEEELDDEIPWPSFADAVTALLFVFIATTFWFMMQLEEARQNLESRTVEKEQELERLKGADRAAGVLLDDVAVCLTEGRGESVRLRPVIEQSTRTMALYIEPLATQVVEWFPTCSADVSTEASAVIDMVRDCLASEVPRLAEQYTVVLTLEGHTDARPPGRGCSARFPSNWELSGARSGAALRRLLCADQSCGARDQAKATILAELAQDRNRLELIAAGRAESVPALRALCDPDWPGATVDPALDAEVCALLETVGDRTDLERLRMELATSVGARLELDSDPPTRDELLVAWANDPRCGFSEVSAEACAERFRRLRRVDMRVDLRVRVEGGSAKGNSAFASPPSG